MGKKEIKRIRKDAKRLPELRDEAQRIEHKIAKLRDQLKDYNDRLSKARLYAECGKYDKATGTTYITDTDSYGHRWCYQTWDGTRTASVYLNAHTRNSYGVVINKMRPNGWQQFWPGGKFLGANHTMQEARKLALDWITGVTDTDERW